MDEVRSLLLWLKNLLDSIRTTVKFGDLNQKQLDMIYASIKSCGDLNKKPRKRLEKAKREVPEVTFISRIEDQGRRALYPFQRATLLRLVESVEAYRTRLQMVISLLNLNTTNKGLELTKQIDSKVTSMSEAVRSINIEERESVQRQDWQRVLNWLNPVDQREIFAASARKHKSGTGNWSLIGDPFIRWKTESGKLL